jgi:D-alanyl-D-alanine carboxypeptidase
MALLARALLVEFPEYRDYLKLPAIQFGGRVLKNYNSLLERYEGATGMKTGFICASGFNLVASARRGGRELIAVVFGEYGGKARTRRAAELLDMGFASGVTVTDPPVMLADVGSGEAYQTPLDMRSYVCGPRRTRVASEADDDDEDSSGAATPELSHLSMLPIYLGPPVAVSALVPAIYGEASFVAPLPRARPDPNAPDTAVMNAFAPVDDSAEQTPPAAEAIGAAAGSASPLNAVLPR